MLKQVAEGVQIHPSKFMQTNTVAVKCEEGVLLVDPGITRDELACLASDLGKEGQKVLLGFHTHPHFDHLLWSQEFGEVTRYGTSGCAKDVRDVLSQENWQGLVAKMLPPDIADQIPVDDLFARITGLPAGALHIPWDGPKIRIIEHQAHAAGHAALLIEGSGVLIAGDMVSDLLIPLLNFESADPIGDYLKGLELLEGAVDEVKTFIPGHGSVGDVGELRARIKQDRTYVKALENGSGAGDPRLNKDWLLEVHQRQLKQLSSNK
jgi:glyoxylase-like metal-dependent hydrolase (beta-lactamase superfamily II)